MERSGMNGDKHGMVILDAERVIPSGFLSTIMDYPVREVDGKMTKFTLAQGMTNDGHVELVILVYTRDGNDWTVSAWVTSLSGLLKQILEMELGKASSMEDVLLDGIDPMKCPHCRCYRSEDREGCCYCGLTHEDGQRHTTG
jgi:hypothetical protein